MANNNIGNAGKLCAMSEIQRISLAIAAMCVRNTVLEDYHARGSISDDEIKTLMIQVVNKTYTFYQTYIYGNAADRRALNILTKMFFPYDWDEPTYDDKFMQALRLLAQETYDDYKNNKGG